MCTSTTVGLKDKNYSQKEHVKEVLDRITQEEIAQKKAMKESKENQDTPKKKRKSLIASLID